MQKKSKLNKCSWCGKALTDPRSISLGIGPECLKAHGTFVGGCGASVEEIEVWRESSDPVLLRWVKVLNRAIANKDAKYTRIYIDAARRCASVVADAPTQALAA